MYLRTRVLRHYKFRIEVSGLRLDGLSLHLEQGKINKDEFNVLKSICESKISE